MSLIEWSPAYSVKVKKFDDQHKKLIELINQLHDAMKAGQGNAMLGEFACSVFQIGDICCGDLRGADVWRSDAGHGVDPRCVELLRISNCGCQAGAELIFSARQTCSAAFSGSPITGRQVKQHVDQIIFSQFC